MMHSRSSQPFGTAGLRAAQEEQTVPSPLGGHWRGGDRECQAAQTENSSQFLRGEESSRGKKKENEGNKMKVTRPTELLKKILGGEAAEAQERWRYDVGHRDL